MNYVYMIITIVSTVLLLIPLAVLEITRIDKRNKIRYASILHKIRPGINYPYWRLEEMLKEQEEEP